jgi:hypothetical protein
MRRQMFVLAGLAGAALFAGEARAQAALTPSGPWNMNFAENSCIASRRFGTGEAEVQLGLRMLPHSYETELVLMVPERARFGRAGADMGHASVALDGGAARQTGYIRQAAGRDATRVLVLAVPRETMEGLATAKTLAVAVNGAPPVVLAPTGVRSMLRAADTCLADLLRAWNIDPAQAASVVTWPRPATPPRSWFRSGDYPGGAAAIGGSGRSVLRLNIDATGTPSACAAVIPARNPNFDKAGCGALMKRARFSPALDAAGKPVPFVLIQRVSWGVELNYGPFD